ncbi:uncharacterized protein N7487_003455 [Penicillium crustosum]|uniref:uncharacterized protein n=1 Tax=Penicillium crustosum TaxID=36656 RepID=UPI00238603A2|nr:uncharacterized protein N7487_003455 [Penicillium crustosum]KAJ5419905.1 hypothetical protein N7487_003455 [Penicillium crustosum]
MPEDPYYDLGSYQLLVKTSSPECQLWFDRGYRWAQGFNHGEAAHCFRNAITHDETCAMAYWGLSYAIGPNYNKAWIRFDRSDLLKSTTEARLLLQKAQTYTTQETPVEFALIEALKARFPQSEVIPEDLRSLDRSYGEAMRPVYEKFSHDLDIAALTAEALMCFTPRALWNLDTGEPTGHHTVLAQIALPAADRLRFLMPEASHMLHMPTHIDIACGDYRRAVDSNHQAMLSDDRFFARSEGTNLYKLYRAHNIYVKLYSALISGRSKEALSAANRLPGILTTEVLAISSPPMADWAESFLGAIVHVLVRFGRWEEILQNLPIPEDKQLYCSTTSMIYYGRGIALAVLGRVDEAKLEQAKFEAAKAFVPRTRLSSLPALEADVLNVASAMLQGEIQYREGNFEAAFRSLREAVALEDTLPYSDPPPWLQPTRHALGALLLEQGHFEEAELVYREDLGLSDSLPRRKARLNNVWGLHGLHECLTKTGKIGEAKVIGIQKDLALASADVPIAASCFCRLSTSQTINGLQLEKSECCA